MTTCSRSSRIVLALACWAGCCGLSLQAQAQNPQDKQELRDLRERVNRLETELQRLKISQGQADPGGPQRVVLLLETPYLGSTSYRPTAESRYFAAKLIVVNLTNEDVVIERDQISLKADDKEVTLGPLPSQLRSRTFRSANQTFYLSNMQPAGRLELKPGATGSTWVVFGELPGGNQIPELTLTVQVSDKPESLDVNEFAARALNLSVERIGPRDSLGLLTIGGEINTINAGALVEAIDELVKRRVARVVLSWTDSAPAIDAQIMSWLVESAQRAGIGEASNRLMPTIPAQIRELHLAQLPKRSNSSSGNAAVRLHDTVGEAVAAALETAYERLPTSELIVEIENGHPLTRAAALAAGGGRLPEERLDMILKYADDEDPTLQKAALIALRHFGNEKAIAKLTDYTLKNVEPLSAVATESLAASRFDNAHRALLEVLENATPETRKTVVAILANYPRPIWSDTIYEFASAPSSDIVIPALNALDRVGHPKLIELLQKSLQQDRNKALREAAFGLLVNRQEAEAEELAMEYTLEHIRQEPPTSQMVSLLNRTKDQRAVPLLLKHLDEQGGNRSNVINCLAQIGDQSIVDTFVEKYDKLEANEQASVLNALRQLRAPEYRDLAGKALLSNSSTLVNSACQALQADGSPEAIAMLVSALESSSSTSTWSYVCNALGQLGTAEAREALYKARDTGNSTKSRYAQNALMNIERRSPGYHYVDLARNKEQEEKWDEALEAYSNALQLDDALPAAYAGRGHVQLKREKFDEAFQDFSKAEELDPYNSLAVTGKALALIMQKKLDDGIDHIESMEKRFERDALFAYNAACVYGRALEHVQRNESISARDEKLKLYQDKTLEHLKRSVKLGFNQMELMAKDPDLASVRSTPEFQELTGQSKKDKSERGKEDVDAEAPAPPPRVPPRL